MILFRSVIKLLIVLIIAVSYNCSYSYGQDSELKRVNDAIEKANRYMESRLTQIQPNLIAGLLDFKAFYHTDLNIDTASIFKGYKESQLNQIRPFLESYNIDKNTDEYYITGGYPSINRLIVRAKYCQKSPVSDAFYDELISLGKGYDYDLTHSFIVAMIIKHNECAKDEKKALIDSLGALYAMKISKIINVYGHNVFNDLVTESQALLLFSEYDYLADKNYIQVILANQEPNGGWLNPEENYRPLFNDHITYLCLWSLYEYKYTLEGH